MTAAPFRHEDASRMALLAFLPRIEVRHLAYPVRWVVSIPGDVPTVSLIAYAIDRDTGLFLDVTLRRAVPPLLHEWPDRQKADFLLQMLADFLVHEARETFLFDGERVFDPHTETP